MNQAKCDFSRNCAIDPERNVEQYPQQGNTRDQHVILSCSCTQSSEKKNEVDVLKGGSVLLIWVFEFIGTTFSTFNSFQTQSSSFDLI
ncbi:hypothetical protein SDJN03_19291, partial [Cucurbita argyrosperma subsp. sororia]